MKINEGNSKIVTYLGNGLVDIRLKPTVYSHTYNRNGVVEGSDALRLKASKIFTECLKSNGISHSYKSFTSDGIISELVYEPEVFEPNDLTESQINSLPRFCPIEVVVKTRHVGTPKHRYHNMSKYKTRFGEVIEDDKPYGVRMVRFDWRNPNEVNGVRTCDEIMSEEFANLYIDVHAAKITAINAFIALETFLASKKIRLDDICFFISQQGDTIFSEISPDCMRVHYEGEGSLDKDVWRAGGSSPLLIQKWTKFAELIS